MSSPEKEKDTISQIVRKASPDDIDELKQLLLQANAYSLQLSDVPTWRNVPISLKAVEQQVNLGNTYIIRDTAGIITSTISLSETNEPWDDTKGDKNALYFTKFMKHPEKARTEEPGKLLLFAENEAKKRGKKYLRCDIVREQKGLLSYYEQIGFYQCGDFFYKSNQRPGILLERPIEHCLKKKR